MAASWLHAIMDDRMNTIAVMDDRFVIHAITTIAQATSAAGWPLRVCRRFTDVRDSNARVL